MLTVKQELQNAIRKMLVQNAIDCTYYVALGTANATQFSKDFPYTIEEVKNLMAVECASIVAAIEKLKPTDPE